MTMDRFVNPAVQLAKSTVQWLDVMIMTGLVGLIIGSSLWLNAPRPILEMEIHTSPELTTRANQKLMIATSAAIEAPKQPSTLASISENAFARNPVHKRVKKVKKAKEPIRPINLNKANLADLDQLPGIGPAIARRVLEYRKANGPFTTVEQIKDVKGIGDKTFEKLQPYLKL